MSDTDEQPTSRARGVVRIDQGTVLPLALVILLIGGGVQYGRQSERLDQMQTQMTTMTEKLEKLTESINQLKAAQPLQPGR